MKALVKFAKGREGIELRDIPKPIPKKNELLIKIMAVGICGTDIHIMHDSYKYSPPVVLGHEYTGIVEGIGDEVEGFNVGDQVISLTAVSTCENCTYCSQGLLMLCKERKSIGSGVNGAMAEYMVIPAKSAFVIPPNINLGKSLVLAEPLACCIRAVVERSPIKAGDVTVVSGPGVIGQLTAQIAKIQGAFVIMSGLPNDKHRLELAKEMGVADVIATSTDKIVEAIEEYSSEGADIVYECSGAVASQKTCLDVVKKSGHYAQVGLFGKEIPISMDEFLTKELTFSSSYATEPTSWDILMKLLKQNKLNLKPLANPVFALEDWNDAFDTVLAKEGYKVVLVP